MAFANEDVSRIDDDSVPFPTSLLSNNHGGALDFKDIIKSGNVLFPPTPQAAGTTIGTSGSTMPLASHKNNNASLPSKYVDPPQQVAALRKPCPPELRAAAAKPPRRVVPRRPASPPRQLASLPAYAPVLASNLAPSLNPPLMITSQVTQPPAPAPVPFPLAPVAPAQALNTLFTTGTRKL